ncbi:MAG: hypothetical protein ACM3Q1_10865 [Bacteroidales bacterium]
MDETKLTADLPTMNVEIVHRAAADGSGEMVTIQLNATPDFRSALPLLAGMTQLPFLLGGPANPTPYPSPFALWFQATQAMLAPWAALARANPFLANPLLAPLNDHFSGTSKK